MHSQIAENIRLIRSTLPKNVQLLCVSKFHPVESIEEAYQAGERCFGESRVQELLVKQKALPKDIEWHFIGHLQTNKIKMIMPFISLIHGVDSPHLLEAINREAAKTNRQIRVLLEVHIAQEETKFGFNKENLQEFMESRQWQEMHNIEICGLMAMASNTDNQEQIRQEFLQIKDLFESIKTNYFLNHTQSAFDILSMGMSDDYPIAIQCGSNLIRIGTNIFGERNYPQSV